ncbi:MAG: thioesterase [Desulfobacteraceae bacterium IS3]|nr:MAG: thioesterase [Desulfobacteraceae bacterium IS3]HAO20217.1 thioesterase [Desulfobacteraceae bacterium]
MLSRRTVCRVIYADTDNMGIAYYANYLKWFEIGRTEMLRSLGFSYKDIEAKGIFLPVSEAFCKYIFPARYDDILTIETTPDSSVKAGMKFDYAIFNQEDRLIAKGYTKHPFVNADGKVVRPPKFLTDLINILR